MLKANVGLSRKLSEGNQPAGFSLNLEGEIYASPDDPEAVIERVKELFDLAEEALSQQIERHQSDSAIASRDVDSRAARPASTLAAPARNGHPAPATGGPPATGSNGSTSRTGTPADPADAPTEPASNKQCQYLQTLAKRRRLSGARLDAFIAEVVGRPCGAYDLSKAEAGAVIDALSPEAAGTAATRR